MVISMEFALRGLLTQRKSEPQKPSRHRTRYPEHCHPFFGLKANGQKLWFVTQEVKPRLRDHFIELLGQVGNGTCGTTHFVGIYSKKWRHN